MLKPSIVGNELYFTLPGKYKYNEKFILYLMLGIVVDSELANTEIDRFAKCSLEGKLKYNYIYEEKLEEQEIFNTISNLLDDILVERMVSLGKNIPLTLGVSAGYDSRLLLLILLKNGINCFTYTYGQVGNFDYDFSKSLFYKLDRENCFFDTSKLNWSLQKYEQHILKFQDYPLSPRVISEQILSERFEERYDIQGYLNDAFTSPKASLYDSDTWDLAIDHFCQMNDQFHFQRLVNNSFIKCIIPEKPLYEKDILSFDWQLFLSFRVLQRVKPIGGKGSHFILPFEDDRWLSFWFSSEGGSLIERQLYLKFLKSLQGPIFFDINNVSITERSTLKKHSIKSYYGSLARINKAYSIYLRKKKWPKKPGAHFCLYTCYCNNISFRNMLNESIERLKKRKVFKEIFIDRIWMGFERGDATAAAMLNGLVSTDILIEVGVFDE